MLPVTALGVVRGHALKPGRSVRRSVRRSVAVPEGERPERGEGCDREHGEDGGDRPEEAAAPPPAPFGAPRLGRRHGPARDHRRLLRGRVQAGELRLELIAELTHRLEPVGGVLRHRPLDRHRHARRHVRPALEEVRRRLVDVLERDRDEVLARERHAAGEELVEDDAEGVDVAERVDLLAARLLGRDVLARADDGPRDRHALDVDRARDAEVGHLRLAVLVEQHVLRLHVAVDEPAAVGEGERPRHLEGHEDRVAHREPAGALEQLLQVLALDVLEDDVLTALVLATVDDRDDVRMAELGNRACLAAEALDVLLVRRELLVEDLDRDDSVEQPVMRVPHGRHSAASDERQELVATRDHITRRHAG